MKYYIKLSVSNLRHRIRHELYSYDIGEGIAYPE